MPEQPTEAVTVDLGDGVPRELRYTFASLRRLKAKFGKSSLNGDLLRSLDEDTLPDLIFEGLVDKTAFASSDALAEMLTARQTMYLVERFTLAYTGTFPDPDPNAQSSPSKLN